MEKRVYTIDEYLKLEKSSEQRHEFIDGQIIYLSEILARAGGSEWHSLIATNIAGELRNRLKGSSCRVYGSDFRIRIPRKSFFAFPDVSIICGKTELDPDSRAGQTATNPKVIVEVLSPSTEGYDRGTKFARYRELASLEEYVLVSQDTPRIEVFLRRGEGSWQFTPFAGVDAVAHLQSVKIDLPLAEAYTGVTFSVEE